jgi:lambda family phage portal protein
MTKTEAFLAAFIDRTIALVSPRAALSRRLDRERLLGRTDLYAGAKTNRLTGSWSMAGANVNDVIGASSPILRARVRQLIRDFPYLARAANILVDYSVGPGIIWQSKAEGATGKPDKRRIQQIEDAVRWWMDEADASGKLHYYELMRLAKRQDVESGEFLQVKTYPKDGNRFLPYAVQIYEADWLTGSHDNYGAGGIGMSNPAGREVRQGIEYDKLTGRVTGYWFADPTYGGQDTYIPADRVIHGFDTLRPQQLRGVSPFAAGVLIASDLNTYLDAEIDGAKLAAKYLAFVKTESPALRQDYITNNQTNDDGTITKIEEMENAIIEYLRPGEEVELAVSNRPGATFQPFVRLILTMLSITTGAPYELISGDYQGLNFSTARIVRNDFAQQLRPVSVRHIRQFGIPTIRTAIDMAVLTGKLTLPGYWQDPRRYLLGEWQPPGMDAVDPLRESKSQIEAISFGLKSPQEVARERSKDLESIYKEIKAAKDLAEEMGLEFATAKTTVKSNPAAIHNEGTP